MKYNFDEIIERRGTHALNTDGFRGYIFHAGPEATFKFKDEEFVRMWVADMEFAVAEPICDALFVGNAKGCVRLNMAMPRSVVAEGLKRICDAINRRNGGKH